LARKKEARDAVRELQGRAEDAAEQLLDKLARVVADVRRRPAPEGAAGLLLDAALLVPKKKTATLRKTVETFAACAGDHGLDVTLTGPWPPYNFVSPA